MPDLHPSRLACARHVQIFLQFRACNDISSGRTDFSRVPLTVANVP